MPYYLDAILTEDRAHNCYQVVVIFDPDDPNSIVCQTDAGSIPTGHQYDPNKTYITPDEIDRTLTAMGFRVVGGTSKNRTVVRANSSHTFYDPGTREWYTCDPNGSR